MTAKRTKSAAKVEEPLEEFEVDSSGTLTMVGVAQPRSRAEAYEDVADSCMNSPEDLADAMDDCEPLAWAVHSIYDDVRNGLEKDLASEESKRYRRSNRLKALRRRIKSLPAEPEEGAPGWLLGLSTVEFAALVVPKIEEWFRSPPDWTFEDDYLPESTTSQGAALAYFSDQDASVLETLGIQIVEGECPGSSYYAAELTKDVAVANLAAEKAGVRVRFKRTA